VILIGQDALGGWAWMLLDLGNRMVASGHALPSLEAALDHGMEAWAEARIRGEAVPERAKVHFPDG
jgi:hypothetical protein